MRVLLVNKFHYRKGGSETYYFAIAEALQSQGHEVAYFAMKHPQNEPCEQEAFFVSQRDYNGKASVGQRFKDVRDIFYSKEAKDKFELLVQDFRPDVIHLNLVHRQITFSILDAPSVRDIPVVYTAHDYIPVCPCGIMIDGNGAVCDDCLGGDFCNCVRKKCVKGSTAKSALAAVEAEFLRMHGSYGKVDRFIAPSETMRAKLVEGGFPERKVLLMRNFAMDEPEVANPGARRPELLFFGRLSREKGVDTAVAAFIAAADRLPGEWKLLIAGDGPERGRVEELVREYGMEGRIKLLGKLDAGAMRRRVASASFAVASSRWLENMPYSTVEALGLGTPVIGSRMSGIAELVREGETGFLFGPDDVAGLAEKMLLAARMSGQEYRVMQERCCAYVRDNCSREAYMRDLIALYEGLVEERARAMR